MKASELIALLASGITNSGDLEVMQVTENKKLRTISATDFDYAQTLDYGTDLRRVFTIDTF